MADTAPVLEHTDVRNMQPDGRIVVGVDGSAGSHAALKWAMLESRLRGSTVHAVLGWVHHPHWGYSGTGGAFPPGYQPSGGSASGRIERELHPSARNNSGRGRGGSGFGRRRPEQGCRSSPLGRRSERTGTGDNHQRGDSGARRQGSGRRGRRIRPAGSRGRVGTADSSASWSAPPPSMLFRRPGVRLLSSQRPPIRPRRPKPRLPARPATLDANAASVLLTGTRSPSRASGVATRTRRAREAAPVTGSAETMHACCGLIGPLRLMRQRLRASTYGHAAPRGRRCAAGSTATRKHTRSSRTS
jgi:Universal stress protein family.